MIYLTALPDGLSRREQALLEHRSGWALLRYGMLREGFCAPGTTLEDIMSRAQRGPEGKPFLPGSDCLFSITHSRGIAGCAVGCVPVGLDIERVREFSHGMVEKICTKREMMLTDGKERDALLTQLWTCKESHMKLTGLGFSQGLHKTEFCSLGAEPRLAGQSGAFFHSTSFEHGGKMFWLTLCSAEQADFKIELIEYTRLTG